MAREYFPAYHSYLELMEQLNDAERGRLFTACLMYSKTGEAPELRGNEKFVFPAFRSQIDRDAQKYEGKSETNRANASKRWGANSSNDMQKHATACDRMRNDATACDRMRNDAKHAKEKEKAKEKDMEKAKANRPHPLSPSPAVAQSASAPSARPADDDDDVMRAVHLSQSLDALEDRWKATGGTLNAADYGTMELLIAEHAEQDILDAMQEAQEHGAGGKWAYVKTVLKNWREHGRRAKPAKAQGTGDQMQRYSREERKQTYGAAVVDFDAEGVR